MSSLNNYSSSSSSSSSNYSLESKEDFKNNSKDEVVDSLDDEIIYLLNLTDSSGNKLKTYKLKKDEVEMSNFIKAIFMKDSGDSLTNEAVNVALLLCSVKYGVNVFF